MNLKKLRIRMAERDVKQYELARDIEVSPSYVSYLMRGHRHPPKELQRRIERALKMKLGALNGR